MSTVLLLLALVLFILELIPADYYLYMPGEALPVASMIHVTGYPSPSQSGKLLMTDVSLVRVHHLLEELYGRLNPDADLQPVQVVSGNLSDKQFNQQSIGQMHDSMMNAEAAALHATRGYSPGCPRQATEVLGVSPSSPAARFLKPGDIITAVDGSPVRCTLELGRLIKRHAPGQQVRLTLTRRGNTLQVRLKTIGVVDPSSGKRVAIIGVALPADAYTFPPMPLKIHISVGDIGGPSAGLMFALGIVQIIQHRDLTRGCTVAGTGEIDPLGNVTAIGGARQKIIAARRAGASYFLVPNDQQDLHDALSARGNVTVVPVQSLAQALGYLRTLKPCR